MKKRVSRRISLAGVVLAVGMLASACQVNGGATLAPFDSSTGTAQVAVSANVDLSTQTFRASGTFRNSTDGVSFTFQANGRSLNNSLRSTVQSAGAVAGLDVSQLRCVPFGGIYKSNNKNAAGSGATFGVVATDGTDTLLLLGTFAGPYDDYGYMGEVVKGNLKMRNEVSVDCSASSVIIAPIIINPILNPGFGFILP